MDKDEIDAPSWPSPNPPDVDEGELDATDADDSEEGAPSRPPPNPPDVDEDERGSPDASESEGDAPSWPPPNPPDVDEDELDAPDASESEGDAPPSSPSKPPPVDVNEAPTDFDLVVTTASLDENTSTGERTELARLTVTDPDETDAFRQHSFTLSGDDAVKFLIENGVLYLRANVALNHETAANYVVTVTLDGTDLRQDFTLTVEDVNEAPTVTIDGSQALTLREGTSVAADTGYTVSASDPDAGDAVTFTVDDRRFEVVKGKLRVKADQNFDFEAEPSIDLIITGTDRSGLTDTQTVRVEVTNLLDEALQINAITDLVVDENSTVLTGTTRLGVTTDEQGDYQVEYRLAGGAAHEFVEVTPEGVIRLKQAPDHEAMQTISFVVEVRYVREGQGDDEGWQGRGNVTLGVADVNEAPTDFDLVVTMGNLDEDAPTGDRTELARLTVTDPDEAAAFRRHSFTLSGDDASKFMIENGVLYLRAGVALNHETAASHTVTVTLDGTGLRQSFTLDVADVNDMATIIGDGALWRLSVEENDPNVGYTPDLTTDDAVTRTIWTLSGDDAHLFTVDQRTGAVSFNAPPDYEVRRDVDKDNLYKVTLTVKTFDDDGREQSATQDLEINVTDVSLVIHGSPNAQFNLRENYNEVITQVRYFVDEDDHEKVEYSLTGPQRDLFTIDEDGYLRFKNPPNFELRHLDFGDDLGSEDVVGALYSVDVVVTATLADGRKESAKKSVWINLLDAPEAPQITLSPNPGFYILTSEESARRDTGYRVSATDEDGDSFTVSLSRNPRFRIRNDSEIWIKKGQVFGPHEADAVTLYLKATDSSPARKTAILKFKIPVKKRLDNIDDMFRIAGEAEVSVDENLPVETAIFAPTIVWGAGYESSMSVIWSLGGTDSGFLRIDAATGIVRFITPPDYESKKTVYDFTITAVAVGGQLVNRKDVTINIQDVDDNAPSEMLVVDVHDDLDFTPAELTNNANRKLAKIRFKDVDSQAGNDVEIDAASREFFEIRAAKQTHKDGVYQLWLKDAVTLEVGSYTIIITAVINGARVEDMQQEFTFTVTTPEREMPATNVDETPSGDDQTSDDGATDDGQPTENRSDKDNEVDRNRQPTGDDTNGNQSVDQKRDNELPTDIENNDTEENPENPDALQQLLNGGNPETRPDGQQGNGPVPKKPATTDQGDTGNGQMTQVVDYPPIEPVHEDIAPQTLDIS